MIKRFVGRSAAWLVIMSVTAAIMAPLTPAQAQGGKQNGILSWSDAPIVPRHRSEADWLVDVGWKTFDEVYGPFFTREYEVGDTEQLIPLGMSSMAAQAFVLVFRTEHAYFWFERGARVDPAAVESTARFFEDHIWPLNHSIYGDEWNPGIDGDSRMHIVNQAYIGPGVLGAFNPEDQCPRALCPESNQREILYISLEMAPLGSPEYLTTLAHEHQHLIQYHVDGNEQRWFNEGLSQLAEHLNGFPPRYVGDLNLNEFLSQPDHQLNSWVNNIGVLGRNYGATYLFLAYLYEQFGLDFIHAVVRTDYDGLAAVGHALDETGQNSSVDGVFADWIMANYLDDPYVGDGRYYYQSLDLPTPIQPQPLEAPAVYSGTVHQYGADYLSFDAPGVYTLTFDGSDSAPVMGAVPHSQNWMWWSYNLNSSAARLTGAFDLTGLDTATLRFSAWWSVEDDFDWFQVLVSDNGGRDWQIVSGDRAAHNGEKAPGAYYSGRSSVWVEDRVDLSAFAGKPVLIRFEYLTDASNTGAGVALDDIGIAELGFADDVETPLPVWTAEGFLRVPGEVSQTWTVSVVEHDPTGPVTVHPVALDDLHTGRAVFTVPEGGAATLVIGAMTPFATNLASYKLAVQRDPLMTFDNQAW